MSSDKQVIEVEESEIVSGPPKRTRYGRSVKKPVRYEPDEKVEDDFPESDYDDDVDLNDTLIESGSESESDDDDSDADENGNLKDFVTYSDSEDEDESVEKDEEEEDFTDTDDSDYSDSE